MSTSARNGGNQRRLEHGKRPLRVDEYMSDDAAVLWVVFDEMGEEIEALAASIGATGARRPASE